MFFSLTFLIFLLLFITISFGDSSNFMVTFKDYLVEMDRKNKIDRI